MNVLPALMVWLASSAAGDLATATPDTRAANFYAADLELPLLRMRAGATLVESCIGRLRRACNAEQRKHATDRRTIALLDELSLFPQRLTEDVTAGIAKPRDLEAAIRAASTELQREARIYDRQLFARFGATLRACPHDAETHYRESFDELVRLNLTGFQSLAGEDLEQAKREIARDESALVEVLRQMPVEDCVAARTSGEFLMELMHSKLQPWSGEDRHVANETPAFEFGSQAAKPAPPAPDPELASAVAGNFVLVVATELHLMVFPETKARIRALGGAAPADDAHQ
jgi:hypothetical protein